MEKSTCGLFGERVMFDFVSEWHLAHHWTRVWSIDKFSKKSKSLPGATKEAATWYDPCATAEWRVEIVPEYTPGCRRRDQVCFGIKRTSLTENTWSVFRVHLAVVDASGELCFRRSSWAHATRKSPNMSQYNLVEYVRRKELLADPERYLPNDRLTIEFTMELFHLVPEQPKLPTELNIKVPKQHTIQIPSLWCKLFCGKCNEIYVIALKDHNPKLVDDRFVYYPEKFSSQLPKKKSTNSESFLKLMVKQLLKHKL